MQKIFVIVTLAVVLLCKCTPSNEEVGKVQGYAPIYLPAQKAHQISAGTAQPTVHAGKIYAYNNYLFQVEEGEGIHIIDNTIPQQAAKVAFLTVPQCTEIAIRSNYLYTNNISDLVVFNLANITAPVLVKRLENAFPVINQEYPPAASGYFECPDPSKGLVVGWQLKMLENPTCRR